MTRGGDVFIDQQGERAVRQSGAAEADLSSQFVSVRTAASEVSGSFTADTRANRLAAVGMLEGDRWLESDGWEYYFDGLIWRYLSGVWVGTDAARGAITPITGEDRALFFTTDGLALWEVVTTTWTKRLEIVGTANQITAGIAAGVLTLSLPAAVTVATEYRISGTKVVGSRGAAVADVASADATDLTTVIALANETKAQLNAWLARARAASGHGLIA